MYSAACGCLGYTTRTLQWSACSICLLQCLPFLLGEGLLASEMLGIANFMGVQDVVNGHPGFINVVLNVSWLSKNDIVHGEELSQNERMRTVWKWQRNILLTKDVLLKISKSGKRMLDAFAVCISSDADLLLDNCKQLVGCERVLIVYRSQSQEICWLCFSAAKWPVCFDRVPA